ncbi:MAG: hypothetical protein J6S21_06080, partial [Victivallales bacterium]|nr:hypothetical protein [Victivallales bacterium]
MQPGVTCSYNLKFVENADAFKAPAAAPAPAAAFKGVTAGVNEISGLGYRVVADKEGFRISYRGQLLQTNGWVSVVEGEGGKWKRALLDNKSFAKSDVKVVDGVLTIKSTGIDTTSVVTAAISENGVTLSMNYNTTIPEILVAEMWFGSLPITTFADCKYTLNDKPKVYTLPTTHEKETEKKSKWRISPDVKKAAIQCAAGTLEISGENVFHFFDGRFHLQFPANARTIGFRSVPKMQPGVTYSYNLKFVENEESKAENSDYKVTVANKSMSITWRGHQIQGTAWPSIVQGPKHFRGLVDNSNFWKYAKVEQNGATTVVTSEIDKVKTCLTAEVQQDGVELTFRYDTDVTPISTADLWFGSQRLEDCAGRNCTLGDKSALHVLPPIIERESSPKSRWRLHGDVYKASLYMDYGILDITGESSFHLFDSRYHGYFPAKARAVSASSMSGMVSGQTYRYKLSVREPQVKITPEAANEKQILMLRPMKKSPVIDGKLGDGEWLDASAYLLHGIGNKKITADTFAYAGY